MDDITYNSAYKSFAAKVSSKQVLGKKRVGHSCSTTAIDVYTSTDFIIDALTEKFHEISMSNNPWLFHGFLPI